MDPTSPGMKLLRLGSPRLEELNKRYASPEALEFRIQHIKRLEAELLDERLHLQVLANRKHNQNERLVPIDRLPDEVLQTILYWEHVRLKSAPREIPIRNVQLMSVSHRWMGIVLDYAQLWSTIHVGLPTRNVTPAERFQILRERTRNYIRRSKQSQLFISISRGVNDIVEELLRPCFSRCGRLEISAFAISEPIVHADLLINLRDLAVVAHKKEGGREVLVTLLPSLEGSGCRLKRLTLISCEYHGSTWPSQIPSATYTSSLISLTIHSSLDPLGVARLLQSCPQLQYVCYTRDSFRAREDFANLIPCTPPPINLPNLQSLIICGEWDILDRLSAMSAPNLAHLQINPTFQAAPRSPTELPAWLLPPSPPSVTSPKQRPIPRFPWIKVLTLRNHAEWGPDALIDLLLSHSQLEQLFTNSLYTGNLRALLVLSEPAVCPRLHTLNFELFHHALHEDALVETLAQVWSSRKHGKNPPSVDNLRTSPIPMPRLKLKVSGGHWSIRDDWPRLRTRLREAFDLPEDDPLEGRPFEIPMI